MRLHLLACVLWIASTVSVAADAITANSNVAPIFANGSLTGCQLVFDVVRRDPEYHRNAVVQVSGSLNVFRSSDVVLKIGVAPAEEEDLIFEAPTVAYIFSGLRTNASELVRAADSDTPGFRMFVFSLGDETIRVLLQSVEGAHLGIAYSMRGGISGAQFPVDLSFRPTGPRDWGDCLATLLQ